MTAYQELKLGRKYKFITFSLNSDSSQIVVNTESEDADYETFLTALPLDECRWAVYDFNYKNGDVNGNKIVFYSWYVVGGFSFLTP